MKKLGLSLLAIAAVAPAFSITVDGTLDGSYGSALSVQTVDTGFGDANPPGNLGGSELNAGYATIVGDRLYLMLTGNLEPNFNKLEVFIDSVAGGENVLSSTPAYDYFNGSNWITSNLGGMTFDTGFTADYHLFARWGSGTGPFEVDFVNRNGGTSAMVPGSKGLGNNAVGLISTGTILAGNVGTNASGTALTQNLDFAINNNNAGGVVAGTGAANQANALSVLTGMEFSIALADLGNPTVGSQIRIAAMIGNGDHNYLSNQILGGLPAPQGNLGGDGNGNFTGTMSGINFNNFGGEQYFTLTVVPEPGTMIALGAGLLGLVARRRRK